MMNLYSTILAKRAHNTDKVKAEAAAYFREVLDGELLLQEALIIWKKTFRDDDQYWLRVDKDTYRIDYASIEERIEDISAGLLKPSYGSRDDILETSTYTEEQNENAAK